VQARKPPPKPTEEDPEEVEFEIVEEEPEDDLKLIE
jgi:hypothetical protein